jgi:hypothetical protein
MEITNVVTGGGIWSPIRNTSSGNVINFAKIEDAYGFAVYEWPAVRPLRVVASCCADRQRPAQHCVLTCRCPLRLSRAQYLAVTDGDYLIRYVVYCDVDVGGETEGPASPGGCRL